jgi:hypothetical protein
MVLPSNSTTPTEWAFVHFHSSPHLFLDQVYLWKPTVAKISVTWCGWSSIIMWILVPWYPFGSRIQLFSMKVFTMTNQLSLAHKWCHRVQRHLSTLWYHLYTSKNWFVVVLLDLKDARLKPFLVNRCSRTATFLDKKSGQYALDFLK